MATSAIDRLLAALAHGRRYIALRPASAGDAAEDADAVAVAASGARGGLVVEDAATQASAEIAYYATIAADKDLTGGGDGACRQIIVGTSGALEVTVGGSDTTIPSDVVDAANGVLDIRATAIKSASTTAAKILVLW